MGITYKTYSDNQLSFALKDVKEAMKLHPINTSYYNKLLKEYNKRYTNNHNKKYIQNNW